MNKPIGKAKRDIKAGETIKITFNGGANPIESEDVEFNEGGEAWMKRMFGVSDSYSLCMRCFRTVPADGLQHICVEQPLEPAKFKQPKIDLQNYPFTKNEKVIVRQQGKDPVRGKIEKLASESDGIRTWLVKIPELKNKVIQVTDAEMTVEEWKD